MTWKGLETYTHFLKEGIGFRNKGTSCYKVQQVDTCVGMQVWRLEFIS